MTINPNSNEKDSVANPWGMVENDLLGVNPISVREAMKNAMEIGKGLRCGMRAVIGLKEKR